ncbi:MAG: M20/M25/M40 family metallo-hydrolase [Proteobacteria bacterium]|nr:M20/M25/M40 family metallo-hydrolase [Pseudomonadota bacterium]
MKKILLIVFGLIVVFVLVLAVNTMMFTSKQDVITAVQTVDVDEKAVSERLSQALQLPTISHQDQSKIDPAPFFAFHKLLETNYPLIHQKLERRIINEYSLLYKWQGSDSTLKPVVLMAHIDVVPIEPGTESNWKYDAFGGKVADGYIWGRGAIDMKSTLTSIMEAVESLLQQEFSPERTFYLALGHDEEIGGGKGAKKIVDYLKEKGVQVAFTIDEGMAVIDADVSPIKRATGIIGLAEKGYVTLELIAKGRGGHSSMPPPKTTLGTLSKAIVALEENQMPASFSGPIKLLFDYLGPEMPLVQKVMFANLWAFEGMVVGQLDKVGFMNAMLRTTTAPTMISGGVKENVLPSQARASVNFRIRPGNTVDEVVAHAKEVIADPDVQVTIKGGRGTTASPVASADAFGFHVIKRSIREVFDDTLVAPGMLVAGTDTKHFVPISDNNYRFFPIIMGGSDMGRIHGTNERVGVDNYVKMIKFHVQFIKNASVKE